MSASAKKKTFENSKELKKMFNHYFDSWSNKNRMSLQDLAERCGVSAQYIAHIGRYGRIPSKPILILLAFNLEIPNPKDFLRAAGIGGPWPYEMGVGLRAQSASESGFLSLSVDMAGFTSAIREIVRAEMKPRTLEELLTGRALRIGLNYGQSFLFGGTAKDGPEGFFPELMQLIALALHVPIEFSVIAHSDYMDALSIGKIDLYGPIYYTTPRIGQALYSNPFCRVQVGGLWRKKKCSSLAELPMPKKITDLRKRDYKIAVHTESMSHHFAVNDLGVSEDQLIKCEVPEESFERIMMNNIPRPAHLVLTDSPHAFQVQAENTKYMELLFTKFAGKDLPYEDTIAVRSDWPIVVDLLNNVLEFLERNGSIQRLYQRTIDSDLCPGLLV